MKDTLTNKLDSFNNALAVADAVENKPLWDGQSPLAFAEGIAAVRISVASLASDGASQSQDITGTTGAFKLLRTDFETSLHKLARSTYRCLLKQGNTADATKVDLTPSNLHDARSSALAGFGETVLDLADTQTTAPAPGQPAPGEKYGITPASVAVVDDLWTRYSTAVGVPASARSKRKAKTDALPGKFADTEELYSELDDLIIQFDTTPAGQHFIDSWFNARQVVALGRHAAKPKVPAPSTPPTI